MPTQYMLRFGAVLGVFALMAACGRDAPPAPPPPEPPPPPAAPAAVPQQPAPAADFMGRAAPSVTLTEADGDRHVSLRRGEVIELRLKADRMSGLTWVPLTNAQPAMRTDGMPQYEPDDSENAQASGTEVWRFIALEPGHVHLRFQYMRPFDREAPPVATVVYHVDIE